MDTPDFKEHFSSLLTDEIKLSVAEGEAGQDA